MRRSPANRRRPVNGTYGIAGEYLNARSGNFVLFFFEPTGARWTGVGQRTSCRKCAWWIKNELLRDDGCAGRRRSIHGFPVRDCVHKNRSSNFAPEVCPANGERASEERRMRRTAGVDPWIPVSRSHSTPAAWRPPLRGSCISLPSEIPRFPRDARRTRLR